LLAFYHLALVCTDIGSTSPLGAFILGVSVFMSFLPLLLCSLLPMSSYYSFRVLLGAGELSSDFPGSYKSTAGGGLDTKLSTKCN
jgi:hypothetical protein